MSDAGAPGGTHDVVVIGAGMSGLYLLWRLRQLGVSAIAYEAGGDVGGTWYWNRYPGARVDIESQEYSFSFCADLEREWRWSERYAPQPEILAYVGHVADRFDLRRDIQFNTRVTALAWDDAARTWAVTIQNVTTKDETVVTARFVIAATGCLSVPNEPAFPGQETFAGATYHTGRWPHEGVDFTGKRVAVIGTGSSAIQSIPQIARQAAELIVFQRTPNYSVPAHNGPLEPAVRDAWLAEREANREAQRMSRGGFLHSAPGEGRALDAGDNERTRRFEERWQIGGFAIGTAFEDLLVDPAANETVAEFARRKIRETVKDPVVAERLAPKDYPFATKRLCVDIGYYETFNRPNVRLVDLRETPIDTLTPQGVRTTQESYEVDAIVFAIGFDAMTGALSRIDVKGRDGVALRAVWKDGPVNYLGLMVAGFPNLFTITGPGSPSVLSNMIVSIEQHVDWVTTLIGQMRDGGLSVVEAKPDAQQAWVEHVNERAASTLYVQANSWYLGANVPGKPRVFMPYVGGVGAYRTLCAAVAENGYLGFRMSA
ncbi:MAG: NAD(P)/FAD-dependent oxidoreductase [Alphaproteobacteria bacterium]|nr:NAD(P)/FAD-dependent oxidoreductase [Alphaproteobacteria bacterium]